MARVDLNHANHWIPEQEGPVLEAVRNSSAIEQVARKVQMHTDMLRMKGVDGANPRVIAEGEAYPEASLNLPDQILEVVKYGEILRLSWEDVSDQSGNIIERYKTDWFDSWAVKFDNACLGVTIPQGTDAAGRKLAPFDSVYSVADTAGRVSKTAGPLVLEDLNDAFSEVEADPYYAANRGVIIAHPSAAGALRVLKDAAGNPVYSAGQSVGGQVGESLFGRQIVWSRGARTSAAQSDAPTGNPLIIFGDRSALIDGVRSGPESILSTEVDFKTDEYELKVRARRGFKVTQPSAFAVVEITAGP